MSITNYDHNFVFFVTRTECILVVYGKPYTMIIIIERHTHTSFLFCILICNILNWLSKMYILLHPLII